MMPAVLNTPEKGAHTEIILKEIKEKVQQDRRRERQKRGVVTGERECKREGGRKEG